MVTVAIGNVASSVGGALATHFFGKKLDQKLTIEKFQEFHTHLNTEILLMEVCVLVIVFLFFFCLFFCMMDAEFFIMRLNFDILFCSLLLVVFSLRFG